MNSDLITFGTLLVQQERIMNQTKDAFRQIIETVMDPIIDILKTDYIENMGTQLMNDKIEQLKTKFRESYFENTLIETETTKYKNVPRRFMNDYFSICVYPHDFMNGITTQERLDEIRTNPEFIKHYQYYQNMEIRDEIQQKIQAITTPYHSLYLPVYQTYLDFMRTGEEIASRLDEEQILNSLPPRANNVEECKVNFQ